MKDDLVSVIMPVYNGEEHVAAAVESVLNQTYQNFELIVVDDGSEDGTARKLEPYKTQITLLQKENGGTPAGTRNHGLPKAQGDLIAFLDHDDLWRKDKLETCVDVARAHPEARFIFSDFSRCVTGTGEFYALSNSQIFPFIYEAVRDRMYKGHKAFVVPGDKMFEVILKGYPLYPSTMVMRRDLFDTLGSWNANPAIRGNEDFDISVRSTQVTDFIYIDERLVTIQRHEGNISDDIVGQLEGDLRAIDLLLAEQPLSPEAQRLMTHYKGKRLCGLGHTYLRNGAKTLARRKYLDAMRIGSWRAHALLRYGASFIR